MFTLLTTAKTMNDAPARIDLPVTPPHFMDEATELMDIARALDADAIQTLMGVSPALAEETVRRFRAFTVPLTRDNATPAVFAFSGDVYRSFDAPTVLPENLIWAQEHLGIVSGLFGLLRPLDLIQPYRLEMATRLPTGEATSLYDFWGDRLAERINDVVGAHDSPVVVNLASAEYLRAVRPKRLRCPVVTPVFHEVRPGEPGRVMAVYAKRARGRMARFIVENRVDRIDGLREFNAGGYRFVGATGDNDTLTFSRPFAG